jgi:signal peptidase I
MRRLVRGLGWLLFVVLLVTVVARLFFVEVAEVGHDDMAPTLRTSDQTAVYTRATLERGDVVVCEHPSEPGRKIVGRLLGMPGDVLSIRRGKLSLGGVAVGTTPGEPGTVEVVDGAGTRTLSVIRETLPSGRTYRTALDAGRPPELREVRVQSGYYLLSDQRTSGTDSRRYGEVHPSLCAGRAVLVLLPLRAPDGTSRALTSIE